MEKFDNINEIQVFENSSYIVHKIKFVFNKILERYPILCSYFVMKEDGTLFCVSEAKVDFEVEYSVCKEVELNERIQKFIRPFNVESFPLFRIGILQIEQDSYVLLFDIHHIICDGISIQILMDEFTRMMNNFEYIDIQADRSMADYSEYAEWLKNEIQDERINAKKAFWVSELPDIIPRLELPTDFVRRAVFTSRGQEIDFKLSKKEYVKVRKICRQMKLTQFMFFLGAFALILYKYSGQSEFIIGIPINQRGGRFINTVGPCINYVPFYIQMDSRYTVEEYFQVIREKWINILQNQDYPFNKLIHDLGQEREISHNLLFDVMFDFRNDYRSEIISGEQSYTPVVFHKTGSKMDITLFAEVIEGNCNFRFEYNDQLFKEQRILDMGKNFLYLIGKLTDSYQVNIEDISVSRETEQLYIRNIEEGMVVSLYKNLTVYSLFEKQVKENPNAVAVIYGSNITTYYELFVQINRYVQIIRKYHIGQQNIVAINIHYSKELISCIFAVMKAGAAFVLLDQSLPDNRIESICRSANVDLLITEKDSVVYENKVLWSDFVASQVMDVDEEYMIESTMPAYVVFTSGTTQEPKGIVIGHKSLFNYISWAMNYYLEDGFPCIMPLFTSISFDLTFTSIFLPLASGGSLVIYDNYSDANCINRVIEDNQVSIIKLTPSHILLLDSETMTNSSIRKCILGGEALIFDAVKKLYEFFNKSIEIYNEYGPAEATIGCMEYKYNPNIKYDGAIPIGKPIQNTGIYLLDSNNRPVPKGAIGQLYVSGESLFLGYLNQPELTALVILKRREKMLYATGDYARYLPNGDLIYVGRKDYQIKIRGHRVELYEIEQVLLTHKNVKQVKVIVDSTTKKQSLIAFILPYAFECQENYHSFLEKYLPIYMLPNQYIEVESIPIKKSGKIDTNMLLQMAQEREEKKLELLEEEMNEREKIIAIAFQKVLGINKKLHKNDNFYGLGGDSIKAIQLRNILQSKGFSIAIIDIYRYQSIHEMAKHIFLDADGFSHEEEQGYFNYSPIQNGILQYYEAGKRIALLRLKNYSPTQVIKTWEIVCKHHSMLRARSMGKYRKKVFYMYSYKKGLMSIEEKVLDDNIDILEYIKEVCNENFDTDYKIQLIHNKNQVYIYLEWNHLILDNESWSILFQDLNRIMSDSDKSQILKVSSKSASYKEWAQHISMHMEANFVIEPEYIKTESSKTLVRKQTEFIYNNFNEIYQTIQFSDFKIIIIQAIMHTFIYYQMKNVCVLVGSSIRSQSLNMQRTIGVYSVFIPLYIDHYINLEAKEQILKLNSALKNNKEYADIKYINNLQSNNTINIVLEFVNISSNSYDEFELMEYSYIRKANKHIGLDIIVYISNREIVFKVSRLLTNFQVEKIKFEDILIKKLELCIRQFSDNKNRKIQTYIQKYSSSMEDIEDINEIFGSNV